MRILTKEIINIIKKEIDNLKNDDIYLLNYKSIFTIEELILLKKFLSENDIIISPVFPAQFTPDKNQIIVILNSFSVKEQPIGVYAGEEKLETQYIEKEFISKDGLLIPENFDFFYDFVILNEKNEIILDCRNQRKIFIENLPKNEKLKYKGFITKGGATKQEILFNINYLIGIFSTSIDFLEILTLFFISFILRKKIELEEKGYHLIEIKNINEKELNLNLPASPSKRFLSLIFDTVFNFFNYEEFLKLKNIEFILNIENSKEDFISGEIDFNDNEEIF